MIARPLEITLVVLCFLATTVAFVSSVRHNQAIAHEEFRLLGQDSTEVLKTRMQTYLQSLVGAAAFLKSHDDVSPSDFETYVEALNIDENLPGISGIGLIRQVEHADVADFVARVRASGQPDYRLRNLADVETHFIVEFVYPLESNTQAVGLDTRFGIRRSASIAKARDTGEVQLTPPISLVQHERELPGFLLLLPIFTEAAGSDARTFHGWVYAPFIAENLIAGLTLSQGQNYRLEVYDDERGPEQDNIFGGPAGEGAGRYSHRTRIDHFGRTWHLVFTSTPVFDQGTLSRQPLTILVAGSIAMVLLILMLRSLRAREEATRQLAELRARQMQEREEEYRSVVENAVTAVIVMDEGEKVLFANEAAKNCFGYTDSELRGIGFHTLAVPAEVEDDVDHNAIGITKAGRCLTLDLQCNTWSTVDGKKRTTAIMRDITEQSRMQREIARTKTLYDQVLQGVEIGVFDVDLATGTSDVSETWCRIMGYAHNCNGIDTQKSFLARIHPDDLSILEAADKACIKGETTRSTAEYRVKFGTDEWRWMRSDAVVVDRDADGHAMRLIGTQTDITDLHHARNALETNEKFLGNILHAAPIGMALLGYDGTISRCNDAFSQFFEKPLQDLSSLTISDLISKEQHRELAREIRALMADPENTMYTREYQFDRADGSKVWGLLNVTWFFDTNADSHSYIIQIVDITEQKKMARVKDEFVATVSHELRTPLTSIKGALDLMAVPVSGTRARSYDRLLEIARSNSDRLVQIVNDILDLETIAYGEFNFDVDSHDVTEIVGRAIEDMKPFAGNHDNWLQFEGCETRLTVEVDIGRALQVLSNLISNACKFSDPETEVAVRVERLEGEAIVFVINRGPGVPASYSRDVFKAFSQADSSDTRARGGTGLGLNISRQIVEKMGGRIGFESKPDDITVFWFTMPLADEDSTITELPVPIRTEHDAPQAQGSARRR